LKIIILQWLKKLLIKYANKNKIILNLNKWSRNPILKSILINNIEILKLFIKYANEKNIILELNENDKDGNYSLFYALKYRCNIEIIKLLINYANSNNIIIKLNEKMENVIIYF